MYRLVDGGATTKLFISKRDAACVWTLYLFVLFFVVVLVCLFVVLFFFGFFRWLKT